jgi:hypothetical protein
MGISQLGLDLVKLGFLQTLPNDRYRLNPVEIQCSRFTVMKSC